MDARIIGQPVGRGVSSTGRRPVNMPEDVITVQAILNTVSPEHGGPRPALT